MNDRDLAEVVVEALHEGIIPWCYPISMIPELTPTFGKFFRGEPMNEGNYTELDRHHRCDRGQDHPSLAVPQGPSGVMHKAIMVTPSETESRIINSTMLVTDGGEIAPEQVEEFIVTEKTSKKAS